jgi:hypothetical protein
MRENRKADGAGRLESGDLIAVLRQTKLVAIQGGLFWRSIVGANAAFPK